MILYGNEILDNHICPLIKDNKIVFRTSGTTGEPKVIEHNLKDFLKRYEVSRPGYRTLITLDLSRLGGVDALLHVYFYGGTAIIPETKNPLEILKLIEKYQVELLITNPSMLKFILVDQLQDYSLSSLKIISYGSEKMSELLIRELKQALPGVKLKQTYGLTEVGTLRTHSEGNLIKILDREYKVIDGILYIRRTDGEWFCTQDRVREVDDYLEILGRDSNTINVGGHKVQAERIEEVLQKVGIDSLVYGEDNSLLGQIVVADVEAPETISSKFLKAHCMQYLEKHEVPMKFNYVSKIEYTEAGKKKRR